MTKKVFALFLALVMLVAVSAGCGQSAAPNDGSASSAASAAPAASDSGSASADGRTHIVFYHWTPPAEMEKMQKTFNEMQDKIYLDYRPIPDSPDAMMKLNTMLMAGEQMDVTSQWSPDHLLLRVNNDLYEPLDSYLEKAGINYTETFGPAIEEIVTINDKLWSMPYAYKSYAVTYNKAIFDKMGVEYPKEGWTWNDFRDKAKAVASGEGADRVYGHCALSNELWYQLALYQIGPNAMYKNDKETNFDDPRMLESLKFFYDMQEKDKSLKPQSEMAELGLDSQVNRTSYFYKGGFAMDIVPTFCVANWGKLPENAHDFEVGCVAMPRVNASDPQKSHLQFSDLSLVKASKHKDEAFEFMKFYCVDRPDVAAAEKSMQPPAPITDPKIAEIVDQKVYSCPTFNTDEVRRAFQYPGQTLVPDWTFTTITSAKNELIDLTKQEILKVFLNEQTPEQALKTLKTQGDALIAKAAK